MKEVRLEMHNKYPRVSDERMSPSPSNMAALLERSGISLSTNQVDQLWAYHQLIRQYNSELNLTRIHNFTNMVLKLYVDSILPGLLLNLPSPLLDLGTGPGMPGIPLKIAYPHLEIILAESRQKRIDFLRIAIEFLKLDRVKIVGGIGPEFDHPVAGVVTRAVESMALTLQRIRGCLSKDGVAIFMKGPHCEPEIHEVVSRQDREYALLKTFSYTIPETPHKRRLVVFQRLDEPPRVLKAEAMKRFFFRKIESEQNEVFKNLKKLLSSRGIKKQGKALVSGPKQILEILRDYPHHCEAWISKDDSQVPPSDAPDNLIWYQLAPSLFQILDIFGTDAPLLLLKTAPIEDWRPSEGFPDGCSLLIPFQDPENVGSVIRSAVAFGATQIILLSESANPYHPKAFRASGGTILNARLVQGPSIRDLPESLPIIPLSVGGSSILSFDFPQRFGLLPGLEGPGLPEVWRERALAVPINRAVESLNAAVAAAIALFVWAQKSGMDDRG